MSVLSKWLGWRATRMKPVVLLVLLLASACSAWAERAVIADNATSFAIALLDLSVSHITLTADANFYGLSQSSVTLTRNVTVVGAKPGPTYTYPVIDLNWQASKLFLAPGVMLNLTHVEVDNAQPFVSLGVPIIGLSPNASVVFVDVFRWFPLCLPISVRAQFLSALPRPPAWPGRQQFSTVNVTDCIGEPGTSAYHCGGQCLEYADMAYQVPQDLEAQQGGYWFVELNVTVVCPQYVDPACIAAQGANACYTMELAALLAANTTSSTGSHGSAAIVGILVGLVVLGTVLAGVGYWYWRKRRRAQLRDVEMELDCLKDPVAGPGADGADGMAGPKTSALTPQILTQAALIMSGQQHDGSGSAQRDSGTGGLQSVASAEGITLGKLIGSGCFGRVYLGYCGDLVVAVKIIAMERRSAAKIRNEVKISLECNHKNVVKAYNIFYVGSNSQPSSGISSSMSGDCQAILAASGADTRHSLQPSTIYNSVAPFSDASSCYVVDVATAAAPASLHPKQQHTASGSSRVAAASALANAAPDAAEEQVSLWVVLEFCDMGALSEAYQRPPFRSSDGNVPNLGVILSKARDIAQGMAYLHSLGYCHGDLKCQNVLLASTPHDPAGFILKVADFSLSRPVSLTHTHLSTNSIGTVCYMPPELLLDGHLAPYSDVYSFGVILWELVAGQRPFSGMAYAQIVQKVVVDNARPKFPADCPREITQLAQMCWIRSAKKRPTFAQVASMIDAMLPRYVSNPSSQGEWDMSSRPAK